jgi:dsDNA-specific endonuclease/ATPase MutS2
MRLGPNDPVHVAGLGKGIVREVRNGGRYLVEVKGRSVVAAGSELTPVESPRSSRRAKSSVQGAPGPAVFESASEDSLSLDLHGMTVHEGLEVVTAFLNSALLAGNAEVRIIHGRSGGKLKAALHGLLRGMPSIRGFAVDPRNPGMTIVRL